MMYGYLDDNYFPVFATFLAGDVFLCFFIAIFYRYAVNRRKAHFVFAVAGVAMAAMTLYCVLAGFGYTGQTHEGVANTAGVLSAITGTIMYGSPLEKIFHVFKYKSAAFIPIHLICAGAINNTAWILFAMLTGKYIILVPSFFALAGNLFQVVLYFIVFNPKTHPLMLDKPKDATIEETQTDSAQLEVVVAQSPSMGDNTRGNFQALVSPVVCHEKHLQNSI
jgi:solute carrier family 50 (sugar transporter)